MNTDIQTTPTRHLQPLTFVQDAADHAREDHEEHRKQLQVATQDAAGLDVRHVLCRQTALHDHLCVSVCGSDIVRTLRVVSIAACPCKSRITHMP